MVANLQHALFNITDMINRAVGKFLGVGNLHAAEFRLQKSGITDLTASFCIERRRLQDDARLLAVGELIDETTVLPDGDDGGFLRILIDTEM